MSAAGKVVRPDRNAWRVEHADRVSVIVDAEDYFRAARDAMLMARHQILLIGWDFDARIRLADACDQAPEAPDCVGPFLTWLAKRNPALEIYLLRWDVGALKTYLRPRTLSTTLRWMAHPRIHPRLDSRHPPGASHHQKIVVIDDCLAFCGGIDMTSKRWDTSAHRDDEPGRIDPAGSSYMPWHDATTALQGPVARALGELCRERWELAGGKPIAPPPAREACWPETLTPDFTQVPAAISRTQPEMKGVAAVHEIEQLYLDLIARAERWIYAESQYFASRRIAEAIAKRLDEPDGPEIVIVNPEQADGWLEQVAMDTARARLVEALRRRDTHGRLHIYHPFTAGGAPIYVHAKVLVIDDLVLRVGSSNFNNRSLRLDTECDVTIEAEPGETDKSGRIAAIRDGLLAEHLGCTPEQVAGEIERGGLIAAVESLRRCAGKTLRPYAVPDLEGVTAWLADHEVLDPENPEDLFEPIASGGLFRRLRRPRA
ncbi:phospholipase D-like domain-containing protein [Sphingomonas sp. DG1-23]|uniref:phospholipase D-like domain-containing protein n=1 Tax=Sphingomonas sp. DG1-23 TaxID=3068316 RepID=UPI00273F1EEE|nr:phospholipase D-like domain-containing protein [Sphingomonas sp. DG1-23]MDP5279115.1 phospholipase D-like domain-containing protein [Sphingomonas sp. DG1-23]